MGLEVLAVGDGILMDRDPQFHQQLGTVAGGIAGKGGVALMDVGTLDVVTREFDFIHRVTRDSEHASAGDAEDVRHVEAEFVGPVIVEIDAFNVLQFKTLANLDVCPAFHDAEGIVPALAIDAGDILIVHQ